MRRRASQRRSGSPGARLKGIHSPIRLCSAARTLHLEIPVIVFRAVGRKEIGRRGLALIVINATSPPAQIGFTDEFEGAGKIVRRGWSCHGLFPSAME